MSKLEKKKRRRREEKNMILTRIFSQHDQLDTILTWTLHIHNNLAQSFWCLGLLATRYRLRYLPLKQYNMEGVGELFSPVLFYSTVNKTKLLKTCEVTPDIQLSPDPNCNVSPHSLLQLGQYQQTKIHPFLKFFIENPEHFCTIVTRIDNCNPKPQIIKSLQVLKSNQSIKV